MKYLILGGVAAGTKTAAKLKRENRSDEVVLLTKGQEISYAGCGLPYYIGGAIESRDALIVNTPAKFSALTGVQVLTGLEATQVDSAAKTVTARTAAGEESLHAYDKLIIATGASALRPPIDGIQKAGIHTLRTPDDAEAIRAAAEPEQAGRGRRRRLHRPGGSGKPEGQGCPGDHRGCGGPTAPQRL